MSLLGWFRRKKLKRLQDKAERKRAVFNSHLSDLREIFFAINDVLADSSRVSRKDRKWFWTEFRKRQSLQEEMFKMLLEDKKIDAIIDKIIKDRDKVKK